MRMMRCMRDRGGNAEQILYPAGHAPAMPIVFGMSEQEHERRTSRNRSSSARGNVSIVVDGALFNTRAIKNRLASEGVFFETDSDAEVIMHAISLWGPRAINQFDGCFALAHFDDSSKTLLIARDKIGAKPLYYAHSPEHFVFASEVKAILATGIVSEEIDAGGVATMLAYGTLLHSRTMHTAVRAMPAATYRVLTQVASRAEFPESVRYWAPPTFLRDRENSDDALLALNSALANVVSAQKPDSQKVCVLLSEGLGSAYLAATANTLYPGVTSFTVGVDSISDVGSLRDSDSAFGFGHYTRSQVTDVIRDAATTAIALGLNHLQVVTDREWLAAQVPEWLRSMDQPTIGGLDLGILINAAIEKGSRVQFTGMGAAEVLGASPAYVIVPKIVSLLRGAKWLPSPLKNRLIAGSVCAKFGSDVLSNGGFFEGDCNPFRLAMRLRRIFGNPALASIGLKPREVGLDPDFLEQGEVGRDDASESCVLQGVADAESMWMLARMRELTTLGDVSGAEMRTPFLSPAFREAIANCTVSTFTSLGVKYGNVLEGLAGTILPREVISRPRSSWSLQRHAWRFYWSSAIYQVHSDAFVDSGIAPPTALKALWSEASRQKDPRQAVIIASIGSYLAELPKTLAVARRPEG
jgi:asparagine synthase (glutamine-hydrolysing)